MVARTISQLPKTTTYYGNSLIEISEPLGNGLYSSKSMQLSSLRSTIEDSIHENLKTTYHLTADPNNHPVNVAALESNVNLLSTGNITLTGSKQFSSLPWSTMKYSDISNRLGTDYQGSEDNVIPNIGIVKQAINYNNPTHIGTDNSYVMDGNPFYSGIGRVNLKYDTTVGRDDTHFYMWSIEDNKQDSSETTWDLNSGTRGDYEQMRSTGWLTMWGWLTDRGNVDPTEAWVGLFGQIQYEGASTTTGTWFPLQIQPWIRGVNASTLQYVGFGIPVQKGLRLKVCTGFKVYGSNTGGFQDKPETLTFRDKWIPNTFFGYIVKNNRDI